MNHKEFFDILIGNPPPEVELEIEIKCREVKELPNLVIKDYCCDLVKQVRLQDMLLIAALVRISETETELYRLERRLQHYKNQKKLGLIGKLKYVLFGNRTKK
tara:strand:+ start:135 stop:443 length:309 start_codon:yes stop_codon:yes gene_type:complete